LLFYAVRVYIINHIFGGQHDLFCVFEGFAVGIFEHNLVTIAYYIEHSAQYDFVLWSIAVPAACHNTRRGIDVFQDKFLQVAGKIFLAFFK
jgi:hypothetical protein